MDNYFFKEGNVNSNLKIDLDILRNIFTDKSGIDKELTFKPQRELYLNDNLNYYLKDDTNIETNSKKEETMSNNADTKKDNYTDNSLLRKKRINNYDNNTHQNKNIPKEIEILSNNTMNYNISLNSFIKYKFYKKYCEIYSE